MNYQLMTQDQIEKAAAKCGVTVDLWKTVQDRMASIQFGIEIEMLVPVALLQRHNVRVGGYGNRSSIPMDAQGFPKMCVGYDSSLSGYCTDDEGRRISTKGIEVSSKILTLADLPMLIDWLAWVNENLAPKVNKSCGLHIHIDVDKCCGGNAGAAKVARFLTAAVKNTSIFNVALYSQTGSLYRFNTYYGRQITDSEKTRFDADIAAGRIPMVGRTTYLQTQVYNRQGTMEFRAFAATTNMHKVLHHLWTALAISEMSIYGAETAGSRYRWNGKFTAARDGAKALKSLHATVGHLGRQDPNGIMDSNMRAMRSKAREMADKFTARVLNREARTGSTFVGM